MGLRSSAIVVGAGLSGLTAAHRLQQAGWDVTVLERDEIAGGRVRTVRTGGYVFDLGATAVGAGYDAYMELAQELDLAMVMSPPCMGIVRDNKVHELRIDRLVRSGLSTRLVSSASKLRMARLAFDIGHAKVRGRLDYTDLGKSAPIDTETAREYALRALNAELDEYLCSPMTRTMLIADSHRTSKVEMLSGLANAMGGGWQSPAGGAARIVEALVDHLEVRLKSTVDLVTETSDAVQVVYSDTAGRQDTVRADACVVACPLPAATAICPGQRDALAPLHAELPYTKTICVAIGTTRRPDCPAFMVLLPPSESKEIGLFFQDHRKDPDRAPAGHGLFTLYFEMAAAEEMFEASDEAAIQIALGSLVRLWPELEGTVDYTHVHRWSHALPHTRVGTFKRIADFNAKLDPAARIQFAADYMSETGQNTAVTFGGRAAANLQRHHAANGVAITTPA